VQVWPWRRGTQQHRSSPPDASVASDIARGKTTLTQYQAFDELSQDFITSISSPGAIVTNIAREVFGKPGAIVRSGPGPDGATVSVLRQYVYYGCERLCKSIDPETASTIKDDDAANNVTMTASGLALPSTSSCDTASVPAAKKIITTYDALNRPTATASSTTRTRTHASCRT
jgi:hypothetical protein